MRFGWASEEDTKVCRADVSTRKESRRRDSNPRSPASDAGGHSGLAHTSKKRGMWISECGTEKLPHSEIRVPRLKVLAAGVEPAAFPSSAGRSTS